MKKLLLTLAGVLVFSLPASVEAEILLNEVHLRTPASSDTVEADGNHEFIELKSTDPGGVEVCTDLWILVIDNDGGSVGEIKQAWALKDADGNWLSTGTNGLLLLGDDYTRPDSPYQFIKAPQTTMGDPDGMGGDNLPDADAVAILLVRGYTLGAAVIDPDVDIDNDGVGTFDWTESPVPAGGLTAAPWSGPIVDSVGFNGDQNNIIKITYSPVNLSQANNVQGVPRAVAPAGNFFPHSMARNGTDNNANSRAAWYGGKVSGNSADSVTYGLDYFNLTGATWSGLVTPGQPNLSSAPVPPVFRINEINANPPGEPGRSPTTPSPTYPEGLIANDGKFEYIEIVNITANQAGGSNFSASLANYSLLVVDSGGTAASLGKVREAWNLSKFATGPNGLLIIGDDYPGGYAPFSRTFDPATQLGDPDETAGSLRFSKMSMGDISNNGVTFLLVQNFTGASLGDLPTDLDIDDDGTLNAVVPYTLIDSVAVPEVDANNALVANHGGYSAAKPDIVVGTLHYNADNLSRLPGNTAVNSTAAWSAGTFGSNDPYGLPYRNGFNITGSGTAFRSAASPGRANYSALAPPVAGSFRLNEVHLNPPTAIDNTEFVEVISTAPHALMTSHWLIVLEATSSAASGRVTRVIDLRGQATGANGLAVFADGIEEGTNRLLDFASAKTVLDDPASFNADGTPNPDFNFAADIIPNGGASILLVTYIPATPTGVPATPGADLDMNNDGILDAAPPWTLVDGISTGNGVGGVPVLATSGYFPGNVSRKINNTVTNSAGAWFGGELTGDQATSFDYSSNYFDTFKGAASPGRHNVTATPDNATGLLLNEININPPGGDNNNEFVELRSANNSALSTNGYSILLVDSDGADTGRVLEVWDLDSAATGSNGLLLAGSNYGTTIPWSGAGAPEAATKLFSPEGMEFDDIGLSTDNGAMTMLLVKDFRGRAGDDLNEGKADDRTAPDDLIFNTPLPWKSQADSVAMQGFLATTVNNITTYSLEGIIFSGTADLTVNIRTANGYTPDTVARFDGNTATNNPAAWYGANIFSNPPPQTTSGTTTAYDPAQYFPSTLNGGKVTPGQKNVEALTDSSDTDGDGVPYLMEIALGTNPLAALSSEIRNLPQPSLITANAVLQPAFTVIRPNGGVPGIIYTVQASFDLQDWDFPSTSVTPYTTTPNSPKAGYETQVWLLRPAFLSLLPVEKRVYFRLKVQRQ